MSTNCIRMARMARCLGERGVAGGRLGGSSGRLWTELRDQLCFLWGTGKSRCAGLILSYAPAGAAPRWPSQQLCPFGSKAGLSDVWCRLGVSCVTTVRSHCRDSTRKRDLGPSRLQGRKGPEPGWSQQRAVLPAKPISARSSECWGAGAGGCSRLAGSEELGGL
ncbi:hypothetical protein KIL84_000226 [Mauremys mutica]|uniref:Uncharacterized protein n=1 Tax=Mauremys mutica TaxID=74926 RepID=A0A9D3XH10_9SAUR|nr:hypothetical protein KIL84_000226 [Mauremys mutica]